MIIKDNIRDYNRKMDKLIQYVILNYSQDIDFNNEIELYDRLMYLLVNGSLNKELESEYFDKLDIDEEKKVFSLVKQYSVLCFKNKVFYNWKKSCQAVLSTDYRYICIKIIDNYDFLINLTINGGEKALRLLDNFSIYDIYRDSSIIEILRNNYESDDILMKIIMDMSSDNSKYNIFSIEQKALLCYFGPEVLYSKKGNSVTFKAPSLVALNIYRYHFNTTRKPTLDDLRYKFRNIDNFYDVLVNYINDKKD